MKLANKIQRFMYGRYGIDKLSKFFLKLYILSLILDIFLDTKWLLLIELVLIFVIFYRFFSKNIYQRNKENREYIKFRKEVLKPLVNMKRNLTDKDYVYRKCPKCKTTLKLPIPYERGIKHTKCPKCKNRFAFLVLKKEKVEIIRN